MSTEVNFKRIIDGEFDQIISRTIGAAKDAGFGVLTRIDLHQKIEDKLGKIIPKTVILGACNPHLAYEAYLTNTDVASLLPCNIVFRDLGAGKVSVEIAKPTALMKMLGNKNLENLAAGADALLVETLQKI